MMMTMDSRRHNIPKSLRNTLVRGIPVLFKLSILEFLCRPRMTLGNCIIEKASEFSTDDWILK
jgi:hypothetical protein